MQLGHLGVCAMERLTSTLRSPRFAGSALFRLAFILYPLLTGTLIGGVAWIGAHAGPREGEPA
jgi:hypothetical protein